MYSPAGKGFQAVENFVIFFEKFAQSGYGFFNGMSIDEVSSPAESWMALYTYLSSLYSAKVFKHFSHLYPGISP